MNIYTLLSITLAAAVMLAPSSDTPTFGRPLQAARLDADLRSAATGRPLQAARLDADLRSAATGRPLQAAGESFSISGKIESIDYASNVMIVTSHGNSLSIVITPTTTVERDGEIGGVSDLRRGTLVRVKGFTRDDGAMVAVSIVVKGKSGSDQ